MKYQRLSKEQFEELHQEFINFLATQSITGEEWTKIKKEQPEVAEQELDIFSDLIWEGVLQKASYIEHYSKEQLYLFHLAEDKMNLIVVKVKEQDLRTSEGMSWLKEHVQDETVELFTATKKYSAEKNADKFQLIQQGGIITKGEWYNALADLIAK